MKKNADGRKNGAKSHPNLRDALRERIFKDRRQRIVTLNRPVAVRRWLNEGTTETVVATARTGTGVEELTLELSRAESGNLIVGCNTWPIGFEPLGIFVTKISARPLPEAEEEFGPCLVVPTRGEPPQRAGSRSFVTPAGSSGIRLGAASDDGALGDDVRIQWTRNQTLLVLTYSTEEDDLTPRSGPILACAELFSTTRPTEILLKTFVELEPTSETHQKWRGEVDFVRPVETYGDHVTIRVRPVSTDELWELDWDVGNGPSDVTTFLGLREFAARRLRPLVGGRYECEGFPSPFGSHETIFLTGYCDSESGVSDPPFESRPIANSQGGDNDRPELTNGCPPPDDSKEAQLARKFVAHSRSADEALEDLMVSSRPKLEVYLWRLVKKNKALLDDLITDAFSKFSIAYPKAASTEHPVAYLKKVAKNLFRDHCRRQRPNHRVNADTNGSLLPNLPGRDMVDGTEKDPDGLDESPPIHAHDLAHLTPEELIYVSLDLLRVSTFRDPDEGALGEVRLTDKRIGELLWPDGSPNEWGNRVRAIRESVSRKMKLLRFLATSNGHLSDQEAKFLSLHRIDGMNYPEIEAELGLGTDQRKQLEQRLSKRVPIGLAGGELLRGGRISAEEFRVVLDWVFPASSANGSPRPVPDASILRKLHAQILLDTDDERSNSSSFLGKLSRRWLEAVAIRGLPAARQVDELNGSKEFQDGYGGEIGRVVAHVKTVWCTVRTNVPDHDKLWQWD